MTEPVWNPMRQQYDKPAPSLAAFLLARISEDEAEAKGALSHVTHAEPGHAPRWGGDALEVGPARVLAECEAKRKIVELHELGRAAYPDCTVESDPCCMQCTAGGEYPGFGWPCATLAALAAVYADHPDYRTEWRADDAWG